MLKCNYCKRSLADVEFVLRLPLMKVCFDCASASNAISGKKSITKEEFMKRRRK